MAPLEFLFQLEALVIDKGGPFGLRLCGSAFLLMVFAPLRFADTIEIEEMWRSKTAICGRSVDQKNPPGPLTQWAAVRKGVRSNGAWLNPVPGYWE